MPLQNKTVIVTGIGPGLGRTIAEQASAMGAQVAMVSRSLDMMDEVERAIIARGGQCLVAQADITSDVDCRAVVQKVVARFGKIDGLVNSAYRPGAIAPVIDLDPDDLASAFNVTVLGTMRMIKAVVPVMEANGGGSIVNVGSQVARKYVLNQGGYAATKAAMASLTRYLAVELGPKNIRVNTPAIGWTMSAPARAWLEDLAANDGPSVEQSVSEISANMALGRVPTDEECARAILMPLSDLFSAMTGATIDVNGGEYLPL